MSSCAQAVSAGSPLHGSPKTKKIVIRRKGPPAPHRLGLDLSTRSPGGKRRRSSSEDEEGITPMVGTGLGAAFDAVA
jgi:hypothetical protein